MPFQKGHKKTGGRKKSSENKITAYSKEFIQRTLDEYTSSPSFAQDLAGLTPKERIDVMIKLMTFITPKPQTIAISTLSTEGKTIEDTLAQLAQEND